LEIQREVPSRLLEIANESTKSRAAVIKALIKVLSKPNAKKQYGIPHKWLTAVDVLGRLRATEAIDALVKNIDQTDLGLMMVYTYFGPSVVALTRIGEPAVPALIEALFGKRASVRRAAAYTLGLIGGADAEKALRKALKKERNKEVLHYVEEGLPKEGPRVLPSFALERVKG